MTTSAAQFGFTKLLVNDLERTADFYKAVCGLDELARVESVIGGRAMSEIMFKPTAAGAATFVLLRFHDAQAPAEDEVITGFITPDLDGFVARVEAAGGSIHEPIRARPEHGVKVAFVKDPEGHLIEVVELI